MAARYVVHHNGEPVLVTVYEEREGYRLEFEDGETVHVDVRTIGAGPHRSLLIDGKSYEADTMPAQDGIDVYISGDVYHLKVTDELWAQAEEAAHGGSGGGEQILSPMPGAVVDIPVKVGQTVAPGETVAVVEAMKMQNDLAAVRGGTVVEVRAAPGEVVDQGAVLVVLRSGDDGAGRT